MKDLMIPRYEVIGLWPDCHFKIGDILIQEKKGGYFVGGRDEYDMPVRTYEHHVYTYPHLFRRLQWWEKRKPEEMPEYVRLNPKNTTGEKDILKVTGTKNMDDNVVFICHTNPYDNDDPFEQYQHPKYFIPATEQEYNEYVKA